MTNTTSALTARVAERVAMVARIGPAHGVHTIPSESPVVNPPANPVDGLAFLGLSLPLSLETAPSTTPASWGITSVAPRNPMIKTEIYLRISGSNGIIVTMYAIVSVNIEKLVTTPIVIPSGLLCPPVAAEDKTIGRIGQIQGAAIVTSPERNAKSNSMIIFNM